MQFSNPVEGGFLAAINQGTARNNSITDALMTAARNNAMLQQQQNAHRNMLQIAQLGFNPHTMELYEESDVQRFQPHIRAAFQQFPQEYSGSSFTPQNPRANEQSPADSTWPTPINHQSIRSGLQPVGSRRHP